MDGPVREGVRESLPMHAPQALCDEARARLRQHLVRRIDGLRIALARYRPGDRLGGDDANLVLAELLRLRALAPLAGLPAWAGDLLAGAALAADALLHRLLRFEVLLGHDEPCEGKGGAADLEALDERWREARERGARIRLQELGAGALARLARELAGTPRPVPDRLDATLDQWTALLALLGMEPESLALLRCRLALHREVQAGRPCAEKGEGGAPDLAAIVHSLAASVRASAAGLPSPALAGAVAAGGEDRPPDDEELLALARAEFSELAAGLCAAGKETVRVDSRMLLACYRLRLHCRALGLANFALAFDSAEGLLLSHWNAQVPLGPGALAPLRELGALLLLLLDGGCVDGRALALCELALLRAKGRPGGGEALDGRANAHSAGARRPLPLLMPRHLTLLPCARPQWFQDAGGLARRLPTLRRELAFLEQGAARLRVFRIEALAAALREVYVEWVEGAAFGGGPEGARLTGHPPAPPAELLIRAHQRLRAMLNQAAAWQEVRSAPDTVEALLTWVSRRRAAEPPEDTPASPRALRAALHRSLSQLCEVLDRQVHLSFACGANGFDGASCARALRGAQALLRLVLVRPEESPWRRRASGRTAAMNLDLRLESGKAPLLILEADHARPCADAPRLLRRQAGRLSLRVEAKDGRCRYRLRLRGNGRPPKPSPGPGLLTGLE